MSSTTYVTAQGGATSAGNCIPFGETQTFGPFEGMVYNNIPAFTLNANDIIAFDASATNDVPICRSIYFATPTSTLPACNSGGFSVYGWTLVASMQCVGTGDGTVGNFDLQFIASAAYSFPGGQLVIGISTVGSAYSDSTCTGVS